MVIKIFPILQALGALLLLPPTIIFRRKEVRCLSFGEVCKIFMLAFLGRTLTLNANGIGVNYTSANLGSAAFNCVPVTTFFFAFIFRMEKVNLRKASGMAKVGGIMLCIAGVAVLAFYKGPYMKPFFNYHLFQTHQKSHLSSNKTWIIGCFMHLITSILLGLWFVLQALVMETCPSPLVLTCGQTLSSAIQSFVVAIAVERNPSEWKLGWNISLISILYCGIIVNCIGNYLSCWVIKKKGPVFQAVTTPLNLVMTIVGSQFLLDDGVSLGSIIGAMLLVLSLYSVLWGKTKEMSYGNTESKSDKSVSVPEMSYGNTESKSDKSGSVPPEKEIGDQHLKQTSISKVMELPTH
ncbi:WAT1-related protein At5g64700-like isoform X2 [Momordica charantia]|uniref:WAT1-related protein n=1 Tax=Momordica charantia TaxID=3673 RepID=A0A6J1BTL4_MOMCH|nr:WAT1-related protein At5g64700-like isoform X2 [Momordica charantia]